MVKRLIAIGFIFACATAAWVLLGATVVVRTHEQDRDLGERVGQLWGTAQTQSAPQVYLAVPSADADSPGSPAAGSALAAELAPPGPRTPSPPQVAAPRRAGSPAQPAGSRQTEAGPARCLPLSSTRADVGLSLEPRRKGLLWYATYTVDFSAAYEVANPDPQAHQVVFDLALPAPQAVYDHFRLTVGDEEVADPRVEEGHVLLVLDLGPGQHRTVRVGYRSHGLDEWRYRLGSQVSQARDFALVLHTDFDAIDFPSESVSPTGRQRAGSGWKLEWSYDRLLTGADLGIRMPQRLNPGPWVSRASFAAPVSLLLFFAVLFLLATARGISLHPMHYAFLAAAFFSFHLLLAYLADHLDVPWALAVAAFTSVALVVSYVRLITGWRFALAGAGLAQLVYLVLFSCAFFLEGYAGLAITVLCVVTLFAAMQLTGRTRWEEVLGA